MDSSHHEKNMYLFFMSVGTLAALLDALRALGGSLREPPPLASPNTNGSRKRQPTTAGQ